MYPKEFTEWAANCDFQFDDEWRLWVPEGMTEYEKEDCITTEQLYEIFKASSK